MLQKFSPIRFIVAVSIGLGLPLSGAMAETINPRDLPRTPVSLATQAVINEARNLRDDARRAGYQEVRRRADRVLKTARDEFLQAYLDDASKVELEVILDDMFADLWSLRRAVKDVDDDDIEDSYDDLKRKIYVLQEEVDDMDGGNPANRVTVTAQTTYFKATRDQASSLPSTRKCMLSRGDVVYIKRGTRLGNGHVKVTLARSILGCSFGSQNQSGYIYAPHFRN